MDASVPQRRTTVMLRQVEAEPLAARTVMALVPICSGTSVIQLDDPVAVPEPPAHCDDIDPGREQSRSVGMSQRMEHHAR